MGRLASLTAKVKELAARCDIDFVGVAPVSRFENAPEGHKPTDLLPGAKSVISLGVRINLGPQLAQRIAWSNRKRLRHIRLVYKRFGYGVLNQSLNDRAAFQITQLLEDDGFVTVPLVASGVEEEGTDQPAIGAISHRHAAVCAGLGEFGFNTLCLTPEVGPRARFCSIITTAELEPDPLYSGPKLCDLEKCKQLGGGYPLCWKVCPAKVFSLKESSELFIEGRRFSYARMEKYKCLIGSNLIKLGLHDIKIPERADSSTLAQYEKQVGLLETFEDWDGRGHGCGLCLLRCPVGASPVLDRIMEEVRRTKGARQAEIDGESEAA